MEKILLLSDTHSNDNLLKSVLSANPECDSIIHLGDNYEDLDNFPNFIKGKNLYRVPGIYHPQYINGEIKATKTLEVKNIKMLLVHSKNDISDIADLYLYGHTHEWELRNSTNGIFLNPGHLRQSYEKGRKASYALIKINKVNIKIKFLDIQHNCFLQANLDF